MTVLETETMLSQLHLFHIILKIIYIVLKQWLKLILYISKNSIQYALNTHRETFYVVSYQSFNLPA